MLTTPRLFYVSHLAHPASQGNSECTSRRGVWAGPWDCWGWRAQLWTFLPVTESLSSWSSNQKNKPRAVFASGAGVQLPGPQDSPCRLQQK